MCIHTGITHKDGSVTVIKGRAVGPTVGVVANASGGFDCAWCAQLMRKPPMPTGDELESFQRNEYEINLPGKIEFIEMSMSFDGPPILKG